MNRFYILIFTAILAVALPGEIQAIEKVWTGLESSSWSSANNWAPAGVPGSYDDVVFDGAISNTNCNLGNTTIVGSLHLLPSFSGTVLGANNANAILTIRTTGTIEGGTLDLRLSRLKSMQLLHINGGSFIKGDGGICTLVNLQISSGSMSSQNARFQVLGNVVLEGGQLQLGSGELSVASSWIQTGGSFIKSSGIGTIRPSGQFSISGGTFDCSNSELSLGQVELSGGQFIGGNSNVYFFGNLNISDAGIFSKNGGNLIMNSPATINSSSSFTLQNSLLQAVDVNFTGGNVDFGNAQIQITGNLSASNTSVTKNTGVTYLCLDHNAAFSNCQITWGNDALNTGNLSLDNSNLTLGSGPFYVDGSYLQTGNSTWSKSGGFVTLSPEADARLNGGIMEFDNCSQLLCGNWKQGGGSVTHGNIPVNIQGRLEISGDGVYNATSETTILAGDFRRISGTFNHQGGIVSMNGTSVFPYRILGNPSFFILELVNESGSNARTFEVYGTVGVTSELRLNNAQASNRPIAINNGAIWLYGNLNIANYRSTTLQPGSGSIRFSSAGYQTILGAPSTEGTAHLPYIRVEKPGGQFQLSGSVSFGNGFTHLNADILFDPDFSFVMSGGAFNVENLFIPHVAVTGTASLSSSMIILGDLNIRTNGLLMNSTQAITVSANFRNDGRYQNMSGLMNVSGLFENFGEFAANSGSINALSGITQNAGIIACNSGQVNVLGLLTVNNGTFSCNNGLVQVSGSLIQNGGTVNGNLNAGGMTISQHFTQNSGTYDASNGTLNLGGVLTMNGLFLRGNGTINFNGIGPQSIPALFYNKLAIAGTGRLITLPQGELKIGAAQAGFVAHSTNAYITTNNTINYAGNSDQEVAGFAYNNLSLTRAGTKTLQANSSVKSVLSVKNNAIFDADGTGNNRNFTMLSTQALTARIDEMPATASISGNVIVQRWTRGGIRSNRFITAPVDTAGGIKMKQIKDDVLVYGPGNSTNGFDNATVFTSNIFVYNETAANGTEWSSPSNINQVIPPGSGVLYYHLGDRSQAPLQNNTIPNAAVVDFIGNPNQGTVNLPMSCTGPCIVTDNGNGWNLVANPYASPIDWDSDEWIKGDLSTTIYIWNPRINQYASYNSANPGAATNGGSRYIGPGQAFFMKAVGANPTLIANEKVKSSSFPDTLLFRMSAPTNQLRLVLHNAAEESRDEIVLAFDEQSEEAFDQNFDAHKPQLPMLVSNMAFVNDLGERLGVHTLPQPDLSAGDKRIPLQLDAKPGVYTFSASQLNSFTEDNEFFLENKLTGEIHRLVDGDSISITIASGQEDRQNSAYSIVLRSSLRANTPALQHMRVFPNPSTGENITIWVEDNQAGKLEVFNASGAAILVESITPQGNTINTSSFRGLSSGLYTVCWTTQKSRSSAKVTLR